MFPRQSCLISAALLAHFRARQITAVSAMPNAVPGICDACGYAYSERYHLPNGTVVHGYCHWYACVRSYHAKQGKRRRDLERAQRRARRSHQSFSALPPPPLCPLLLLLLRHCPHQHFRPHRHSTLRLRAQCLLQRMSMHHPPPAVRIRGLTRAGRQCQ